MRQVQPHALWLGHAGDGRDFRAVLDVGIKAVVQLKKRKRATEEQILQWCEERLSKIKKPKSVDFMDELPRDINGKVYKRQIRDKYWEGRATKVV